MYIVYTFVFMSNKIVSYLMWTVIFAEITLACCVSCVVTPSPHMSGSSAQLWHCIEDVTVVKRDAGLSFEVKVGLHQRSVFSPLLFACG